MNICMCGAESGYPHHIDCPFPYYGTEDKKMDEWNAKHRTMLEHRVFLENQARLKTATIVLSTPNLDPDCRPAWEKEYLKLAGEPWTPERDPQSQ